MTIDELDKKIEALESRRSYLLFQICENDGLFIPEIILGMVQEIRGITKILKILKGGK